MCSLLFSDWILIFLLQQILLVMERQTLLSFVLLTATGSFFVVKISHSLLFRSEPTETFRCRRISTVTGKPIRLSSGLLPAHGSSTAHLMVRQRSRSSVPLEINLLPLIMTATGKRTSRSIVRTMEHRNGG